MTTLRSSPAPLVLLGWLLLGALCHAGDARHATAIRITEGVRVDGILDEKEWRDNPTIGEFIQSEPHPNEPPTEPTLVWVAYSKDALYIAIRCLDSTPEKIMSTDMRRDTLLYADDSVRLVLDTFHDRRNAYYFATNPAGVLVDGRITENGYPDYSWDGIWRVKARIDEKGWTAEFEIPFKTLAFNPNIDTWGFNISRRLARLREESRWASPSLDVRLNHVAVAGAVDGFEGLTQGIGLDIKPYGLIGFNRDITRPDQVRMVRDAGVDIFYRVTSNLVSSTTFNTDFAETEVDTRQVNLTRFPLFFPEKRAFFLEDAGIFQFGLARGRSRSSTGPTMMPFFSRRIGLVKGNEVPILVGQKLTGKLGRLDVGVLDVQTRDSDVAPAQNFFVARSKLNFWKQSYVGAIVTHGEPTGKTSNSVAGADLRLATSNFLGRRKNFRVSMYGTKSNTPGVKSRDLAYGGSVNYPNDLLHLRYSWQDIGENYKPALGFVRRQGVRVSSGMATLSPRPDVWNIRQMSFTFYYSGYYSTTHKALESRTLYFVPFELEFHDGERVEYALTPRFERLFEPFEIHDDISIPEGDHRFHTHVLSYHGPTNSSWFYSINYRFGSFYTGHSDQLRTNLSWRKSTRLNTSFNLNQYWVRLKEGNFNTRLALFRLSYSLTPYITLSNFVQYDTDSRNIGLQSRLRWIVKPGNEIFLVLNHSWQEDPLERWAALRTDVRAKVNYTFRF